MKALMVPRRRAPRTMTSADGNYSFPRKSPRSMSSRYACFSLHLSCRASLVKLPKPLVSLPLPCRRCSVDSRCRELWSPHRFIRQPTTIVLILSPPLLELRSSALLASFTCRTSFDFSSVFSHVLLATPPVEMSESLVAECLELINELRKGFSPPSRHASIVDVIREAASTTPSLLPALFSAGTPSPRVQRTAIDMKVRRRLWGVFV